MPPPESADSVVKKCKPRLLWITKVEGGRYMITKTKPVIGRVLGTRDRMDAEAPFDPLAFRHICEASVLYLGGRILEPLTPTRIRMSVEYV